MSEDPTSKRAQDLLRHYRDEETLGAAEQARLLAAVQKSIAGGYVGGGEGSAPGGATHGALAKTMAGLGPKILAGTLLLGAPAAWGVHAALVKSATPVASKAAAAVAPATGPASAAAPSPAAATPASTEWRPWVPPASLPDLPRGATTAAADPGNLPLPAPEPLTATAAASPGERHPSPAPRTARTTRAPAPPSAAVEIAAAEAPLPSSLSSPPSPQMAPVTVAPPAASAPAAAAAPPAESPAPAAARPSAPAPVDEEVRLLALAYAQLRAGQPALALATLSEQERRFPNGKLAESRQVARILALCDSGQRAAARSEGARFLAAHPGSPFSNRVRTACAD
jgi:hypothetical protein